MTKASMIRRVAREGGFGCSNKEITREVERRFGIEVGANQVVEVLGSYEKRRKDCPVYGNQLNAAKRFLRTIGDKGQAIRLLNLAEESRSNRASEGRPEVSGPTKSESASGGAS